MGHVRNVPSKRQAVVDDDTKLNLLLALEENPITPARQLARDTCAGEVLSDTLYNPGDLKRKTVAGDDIHRECSEKLFVKL
ncbi:hypothetical protein NQ318_007234 [Aromia moschata]|uniref:Uncharacterized protein n=1 Tax=Aromia moschata TaxID=1265417 RepID=A0AAV8Y6T2_9CUCU|nr:hypothetical protein NQ318_007234 [Aromia moschata]